MDELRLILLGIGVVFVAGVVLYTRWQQRQGQSRDFERRPPEVPGERRAEPSLDGTVSEAPGLDDEEPLDISPREHTLPPLQPDSEDGSPHKIVALHVVAHEGQTFAATDVVEALRSAGLKYGRYRIFHRQVPVGGEAKTLYSAANMIEPGVFDLDRLEETWLVGISLFMTLPGPRKASDAFSDMLTTARLLAEKLEGELQDETHSTLTRQTVHHLREELIAFEHGLKADSGTH